MSETPMEQSTDDIEADDSISKNVHEESENVAPEEEQKEKLLKLPVSRVKNIAKVDPEVLMIDKEATFLIAKSTELFIESFIKEAYKSTHAAKKKIIHKKDIESAVENVDSLMFLEEMLN